MYFGGVLGAVGGGDCDVFVAVGGVFFSLVVAAATAATMATVGVDGVLAQTALVLAEDRGGGAAVHGAWGGAAAGAADGVGDALEGLEGVGDFKLAGVGMRSEDGLGDGVFDAGQLGGRVLEVPFGGSEVYGGGVNKNGGG